MDLVFRYLLHGCWDCEWKWLGFHHRQAKGARNLMPAIEHMHCVRHLHNNFKLAGHSSLALKQRLWAAVRATTIQWWDAEMERIRELSGEVYKWLEEMPASHWSKLQFKIGPKCDALLNNLCEPFNATILEGRDKPIMTMLERIRYYLMLRMAR